MNRFALVVLSVLPMLCLTCPVMAEPPEANRAPVESQSACTVQLPAAVQPPLPVQPPAPVQPSAPVQSSGIAPQTQESLLEEPPGLPSAGLKMVDILLVRPLCLIGSTASTAVYIALSPLVHLMGIGEETARVMVEAPWRFTSCRYIGEFNHYKDEEHIMGVWEF